jgi:hypothetical protein
MIMRKRRNIAAALLFLGGCLAAGIAGNDEVGKTARIFGRVTDLQNRPIAGASVELKNSRFDTVSGTTSGPDGTYSLNAPKGNYLALLAVKDYQTKFLEYWAWNVPAEGDLEINPRFDRLEVYAINAWQPQGALPSYQIYFRPMSLARAGKKIEEAGGMEGLGKLPLIDIAPELTLEDVVVAIDGQAVETLRINKILEASGPNQDMIGYVIQVGVPEQKPAKKYRVITITLTDRETGEKGEGTLFFTPAGVI